MDLPLCFPSAVSGAGNSTGGWLKTVNGQNALPRDLDLARPDQRASFLKGSNEKWVASAGTAVVISRAFSDLCKFVDLAGRLCATDGVLAAMKGRYAAAELARLPPAFALKKAVRIAVPGLRAARHLILLEPASRNS